MPVRFRSSACLASIVISIVLTVALNLRMTTPCAGTTKILRCAQDDIALPRRRRSSGLRSE